MSISDPTMPPFHADHVGSLLRPEKLARARADWVEGKLPYEQLQQVEDECVRNAVAMQEDVGLKAITDGDFRRNDWFMDFMFGLDGIERGEGRHPVPFSGGVVWEAPISVVNNKVAYPAGGILTDGFKFLRETTSRTPKLCIPAPSMLYSVITPECLAESPVYRQQPEQFWVDLAAAYRDAVADYYQAGCRYLQMDDVNSINIVDPNWHEYWRSRGEDPQALVNAFIGINNDAVGDRPDDLKVAIHMCRGNYQSQWAGEGGYDNMAEQYFNESKVDGFLLEYDDERSGGFEPLHFMPKDKFVGLGVITSKRPQLEARDEIKQRIDEAARYVDRERLGINPQCGFASTKEGNKLTEDEQRRKLAYLVEIANEVWGGV